jgi:hypothetical protein
VCTLVTRRLTVSAIVPVIMPSVDDPLVSAEVPNDDRWRAKLADNVMFATSSRLTWSRVWATSSCLLGGYRRPETARMSTPYYRASYVRYRACDRLLTGRSNRMLAVASHVPLAFQNDFHIVISVWFAVP